MVLSATPLAPSSTLTLLPPATKARPVCPSTATATGRLPTATVFRTRQLTAPDARCDPLPCPPAAYTAPESAIKLARSSATAEARRSRRRGTMPSITISHQLTADGEDVVVR